MRGSSIAVAALFALGVAGQVALRATRPLDTPLMVDGASAVLGGFRSLAVEVVWFRADRLQEEGHFVELAQLAHMLTMLEPHTPEVWSYAAWNLAYNVSLMMPTLEDRWRWVLTSMRLLREEGLRLNPGDPELCRQLALLFQLKIGLDRLDDASHIYRRKWHAIAVDVKARGAWGELGMDASHMAEIERQYGVRDWTDPFASALYWAVEGLRRADESQRPFLNEIVRQAAMEVSKPSHSFAERPV